jgi:hypothetical protein
MGVFDRVRLWTALAHSRKTVQSSRCYRENAGHAHRINPARTGLSAPPDDPLVLPEKSLAVGKGFDF